MNTTMENPVLEATQATKKLTFIERMIDGLTPEKIGQRTVYRGPDHLILEIKGDKIYNRGTLKPGWVIQLQDGRARIISVDPGRAVIVFGNSSATSANSAGISATSEVELLDPEAPRQQHQELTERKSEKPSASNPHMTKYKFNGSVFGKSPLARAIVAKYVEDNKKVTVKKLAEVFPAEIMGRLGVFQELSEAKKLSGSGQPRYFFKDDLLVKTDKFTLAVCNQFTTEKIEALIEVAAKLGYNIEPCTNC